MEILSASLSLIQRKSDKVPNSISHHSLAALLHKHHLYLLRLEVPFNRNHLSIRLLPLRARNLLRVFNLWQAQNLLQVLQASSPKHQSKAFEQPSRVLPLLSQQVLRMANANVEVALGSFVRQVRLLAVVLGHVLRLKTVTSAAAHCSVHLAQILAARPDLAHGYQQHLLVYSHQQQRLHLQLQLPIQAYPRLISIMVNVAAMVSTTAMGAQV